MRTYKVTIKFEMPEDTANSIFAALDNAFADVIYDAGGEVIDVSEYIDIAEEYDYGEDD